MMMGLLNLKPGSGKQGVKPRQCASGCRHLLAVGLWASPMSALSSLASQVRQGL